MLVLLSSLNWLFVFFFFPSSRSIHRLFTRHHLATKNLTFLWCIISSSSNSHKRSKSINLISFRCIIKWAWSMIRKLFQRTINGNIINNNQQLNLTWWQIKHIKCNRRTMPIIITCLVQINSKFIWCKRHISNCQQFNKINIISNSLCNRKCHHNWPLPEIITSDNRHPRPCVAMKMDPRVMIATIMRCMTLLWVVLLKRLHLSAVFDFFKIHLTRSLHDSLYEWAELTHSFCQINAQLLSNWRTAVWQLVWALNRKFTFPSSSFSFQIWFKFVLFVEVLRNQSKANYWTLPSNSHFLFCSIMRLINDFRLSPSHSLLYLFPFHLNGKKLENNKRARCDVLSINWDLNPTSHAGRKKGS